MNAYEIPNLRFSLPAGGAVAIRRFVSVGTGGVGIQATAGAVAIGVSMNETKTGEVLEIADGIVVVEAGAAIAVNAQVSCGTGGKAVTATAAAGEDAATYVVGVAMTASTADGQLITIKTR